MFSRCALTALAALSVASMSGCSGASGSSIPEICAAKHIPSGFYDPTLLYASPDDEHGAYDGFSKTGTALVNLMANGNYQIERVVTRQGKENPNETFCFAKLHISGIYEGNSYDTKVWTMAF